MVNEEEGTWRKEGKEEWEEECLIPIGQLKRGPWIRFIKGRLGSLNINMKEALQNKAKATRPPDRM